MKRLATTVLFVTLLAAPGIANAQEKAMSQGINCPNAEQMGEMQKNMHSMMDEMGGMMKQMSDPAMKERMQKMHDHMAEMMAHMQEMHGGEGGMMGGQHMMHGGHGAPSEKTPDSGKDAENHGNHQH